MLAKDFSAALKNQEDALIIARALNDSDNIATTSVSYTHLRAHETVLDLVCRLLLEKKKKKKKRQTRR